MPDRLTMAEFAKRTTSDNVAEVANVLSETNDFLDNAPFREANNRTGHVSTVRTSLGGGTWRQINQGVQESSTTTKQVTETIGLLEALSEIDEEEVDNAPDPERYRQIEDEGFIEGLGQDFADVFIYGNEVTDTSQFTGLAPRLNDLDNGNVWDAGGTGDSITSLYIVQWGVRSAFFIYPPNSQIGIEVRDKGLEKVEDDSGNKFYAYTTQFKLKAGLFVKDERSVHRVCNIDLTADSPFPENELIRVLNSLPNNGRNVEIFANGDMLSEIDIAAKDKQNVVHDPSQAFGDGPTRTFRGYPIKRMDSILSTEEVVS